MAKSDPAPSAPQTSWCKWILLPVGIWLTYRYRWVLDDAFIYFRYAENFSQTGQLVFNIGEYVEGFTSPLWMVLLALTRSLGLPFWPVVLTVSFSALLIFYVLLIRINDLLSPGHTSTVYLPTALLVTNYAVLSHFGSGMETPLVQVCAVSFVYLIASPTSRTAQVLVAIAPVVRPELSMPFALAVGWTWYRRRRCPRLLAVLGLGVALGWELFRIIYYCELLPNTYYLKEGIQWNRGIGYILDTVCQYGIAYTVIFFMSVALFLHVRREGSYLSERCVVWLGSAAVTVHVASIGGDFVHYRYLAFPVCAMFASFSGLSESIVAHLPGARYWGPTIAGAAAILMVVQYPHRELPAHPLLLGRNDGWVLTRYAHGGIEDAMRHRSLAWLSPSVWDGPRKSVVPPRYKYVLQTGWCEAAYLQMDSYIVHRFGLTSPVLARLPVSESPQAGHKWGLSGYAADLTSLFAGANVGSSEGRRVIRAQPRRGSFRAAVSEGTAPSWISRNLRALEMLERKMYAQNGFIESVRLAFSPVKLVL